jgi:cyclophilin family peptidyl-prolyl cis-trans isomerase/HEAT repeat protein
VSNRTRFVPILAVALAACGPGVPPFSPGPERQPATLSPEEVEAIATILRLEDHRTFDGDQFRRFVAGPGTEVRRRAATAAGRTGDPAAAPFLMDVLASDPSAAVRADAAFALGLLGDTSAAVVDALRRAAPRDWIPVRTEEATVVVEVVGALGKLRSDAARAHVVDVLRRVYPADDPLSSRIAAEALLAVWRFPSGAGRAVSAARFLGHPEPELRWRAALALVRMGGRESAERLLPRLEDQDPEVRALAARAIAAPAADSAGIASSAVPALLEALRDSHPHVRINAVRALATFRERAPMDSIVALLRDPDPNVSVAVAGALASFGDAAVPGLGAFVADPMILTAVRAAGLATLAAIQPRPAALVATEWAGGEFEARYAAARTAPALGWPLARPLLAALMVDPDPRVAVAATDAAATLATAGPEGPAAGTDELRDLLLAAIGSRYARQRTIALRGVAPVLRPEDAGAVLAAYEAASHEPGSVATAVAAVRALGSLKARAPDAAAAFFGRFDPVDDRWIRRAVADTLGAGWGAAPVAAASEDDEFYRDLVRWYVAPGLEGRGRPVAIITTPHGDMRVELLPDEAPLTVHNFMTLAAAGYYDGGVWHRVVPNFVIQDGAPAGDPSGGPGWTIRDEINRVRYDRGLMGMALAGPDTGGSQWFITHAPQPHLDGGYTIFGRLVGGERVLDRVVQGEPVISIRIRQ